MSQSGVPDQEGRGNAGRSKWRPSIFKRANRAGFVVQFVDNTGRTRQRQFPSEEQATRFAARWTRPVPRILDAPIGRPFVLTYDQIEAARAPIVYIWRRGSEVIYVGRSLAGLWRPLGPRHHRLLGFAPGDSLDICPCESKKAAIIAERRLIRILQPTLNGTRMEKPIAAPLDHAV